MLVSEKFGGSSYSSLVPTTMSRWPSRSMSPTAGESMILLPRKAPGFGVTLWVFGSIDTIRLASTTSTGKPGRTTP